MKFFKNLSLAQTLYYLCVFGYWAIPAAFLIKVLIPWINGDFTFNLNSDKENLLVIAEILGISLATFFYYELSKVLKPVTEGIPFEGHASVHLSRLGWACIVFSFLTGLTHAILWKSEDPTFSQLFELFRENFDYSFFLIGLFIFVIGYVFKEGERIFEEQKLTV